MRVRKDVQGLLEGTSVVKEKKVHPKVAFVSQYSEWSTLNAYEAIERAKALLEEVGRLQKKMQSPDHFDADKDNDDESFGYHTPEFEVVSYYSVGFVTCLEWHARSRLVDLFSFLPSCITAEDLKGTITDKVLSQMVEHRLSIPKLVGAMLNIGSSEKYIEQFNRIFRELNLQPGVKQILNPLILHPQLGADRLELVFAHRHALVHEIGGAWSDDFETARSVGKLVIDVMSALERQITEAAPRGFPNRLDKEGRPENPIPELDAQIGRLEEDIGIALKLGKEDGYVVPSLDVWLTARDAWMKSCRAEGGFILDMATGELVEYEARQLKVPLRRNRLSYLQLLADQREIKRYIEDTDIP